MAIIAEELGIVKYYVVEYSQTIRLSFRQWLRGLGSGSTRMVIGAKVQPDSRKDSSRIVLIMHQSISTQEVGA